MIDSQAASPSLRPRKAAEFLGIGESTLWRYIKELPDFPRPRKIGPRMTVLLQHELAAWRDKGVPSAKQPEPGAR